MFKDEKDLKVLALWIQEASQTTVLKMIPSFGMMELFTLWDQADEW